MLVAPPLPSCHHRAVCLTASRLRRHRRHAPHAPCAAASPERIAQDQDFRELLSLCGATHEPTLFLGKGPFGRGLFLPSGATCAQVVLSVPLRYALVVRGDLDDADPDAIETSRVRRLHREWEAAAGVELPDSLRMVLDSTFPAEQRLALFLLFAIRSRSQVWKRLGALLPDRATCPSPLLWNDSELAELQDTALGVQCSAARQTASRGFTGFLETWPLGKELHEALGHPTADEFVWALSMVQSRGMADQLGNEKDAPVERVAMLVPFADMANHIAYDPGFSGAINDASDAFVFQCCRVDGVRPGNELTVSYRDGASNVELMRKYGFCTPRNRNDWFMLGSLDPGATRAAALDHARFGPVSAAVIADDGLRHAVLSSIPAQTPADGAASSVLDQASRAQSLRDALAAELAHYPTTVAQDEEQLRALESSSTAPEGADAGRVMRLQAALRYRMERKRLIAQAMACVSVYANAVAKVAARQGR
jgi:Rubisco LSMT substrate-binding